VPFLAGLALGLAPLAALAGGARKSGAHGGPGAALEIWHSKRFRFCWTYGAVWVAGFDLIYACQDFAIDSADPRLHSMPSASAIRNTLILSAVLHFLAIALLRSPGIYAGNGCVVFHRRARRERPADLRTLDRRPTDLSA